MAELGMQLHVPRWCGIEGRMSLTGEAAMKRNLTVIALAMAGVAWLTIVGAILLSGGDKSGLVVCGKSAGGVPVFNCEENNPDYLAARPE